MPNITPTNPLNIDNELKNLDLYKYHPNGLVNTTLDRLQHMLDGKIEIVDPANPFIYLLETNCLNTSYAIQEYTLLTRKLYPRLANNERDLYLHMSDVDYLGRFSEPAFANIMFNILFNDFKSIAVYDPVQKEHVLKLPRHLKLSIDRYSFILTSAIIIRLSENEVIDVKFENQDFNNIFPIQTNFINFNLFRVNQSETYLNFIINLPEVDLDVTEIPVEKSKIFRNILFYPENKQFYFFRGFYYRDGVWSEMLVTHADLVYDIYKPTCLIKVLQNTNSIEYYIPPVYINTGRIGTKVKFVIYTTNGAINVNFKDYLIGDFSVEHNAIFPEQELDVYTEPLNLITKVIYTQDQVISGKNAMSFTELKNNVINNSIGDRKLPITNKQLEFFAGQNNFRLITDVDTVTNRIFLLEVIVPPSTSIYSPANLNLDIIEYRTTINDLRVNNNNITYVGEHITILPEKTIFELVNGQLRILSNTEYLELTSMSNIRLTSEVNSKKYLSLFYHYVLDTGDNKTQLRAYNISTPEVVRINFKEFNSTARVGINSTNTSMIKTSVGFTIDVLANLKKYVNTITEVNVKPYIVYTDVDGSRFFLESRLFTVVNENPIYRFELNSDFYINSENKLTITNFRDNNNNVAHIAIDLDSKLEVLYLSNIIPTRYVSSDLDRYIHNSFLNIGRAVVTLEELDMQFGFKLDRLFTQIRTSTGVNDYELHTQDEPMRYDSTVFDANNQVVHMVNDIVLNEVGAVVYSHRAGDVKLDENNNPISIGVNNLTRFMHLMFIDYRATLSNKTVIRDHRNHIRNFITEKIVNEARVLQNQLLENTEAFVVVPRTISDIRVKTSSRALSINSMQSVDLNVYVQERVYRDTATRDNIVRTINTEINNYFSRNTTLRKTELLNILYTSLKEFVSSVSISKFTELNEEYIEILDKSAKISINKLLTTEPDGYNLIEDITVIFVLV